jgi:hypothetical protein
VNKETYGKKEKREDVTVRKQNKKYRATIPIQPGIPSTTPPTQKKRVTSTMAAMVSPFRALLSHQAHDEVQHRHGRMRCISTSHSEKTGTYPAW